MKDFNANNRESNAYLRRCICENSRSHIYFNINNSITWIGGERAQMIIEYVVVFTVIVAVIIIAATTLIRPSVNKLFQDTATAINTIGSNFVSKMAY